MLTKKEPILIHDVDDEGYKQKVQYLYDILSCYCLQYSAAPRVVCFLRYKE